MCHEKSCLAEYMALAVAAQQTELDATRTQLNATKTTCAGNEQTIADLQEKLADLETSCTDMSEKNKALEAACEAADERYKKEMALRKKYFNLVQELRGNIRVLCRVRPLLPNCDPRDAGFNPTFADVGDINLHETKKGTQKTYTQQHAFEFDRVFPPESGQDIVFQVVTAARAGGVCSEQRAIVKSLYLNQ